jgi:hypothetical protein
MERVLSSHWLWAVIIGCNFTRSANKSNHPIKNSLLSVTQTPHTDNIQVQSQSGGNKYEGYSERNLRWAVNKTINENIIVYKNMYIRKLLLNIDTVGIEALIVSEKKFLHASVNDVCLLWAQPRFDTFHQVLIIVEVLLS